MILNKSMKDNFYRLIDCYRSIAKSIFISLCYRERDHDKKEFNRGNSKPCECQITTRYVKSNSEQHQS